MMMTKQFFRTSQFAIGCLVGLIMVSMAIPVFAQNTGQICVRSFDDRNSNGVYDPGEPFITKGVSANLLDGQNVIVNTALLDDSPQAAQGIMCFQELTSGQYTIMIASADFTPTTASTFVAAVTDTTVPEVFDFGAQVVVFEPAVAEGDDATLSDDEVRDLLQRVFFATIGAALVVGAMIVIGSIFYFIFVRQPVAPAYAPPMQQQPRYGTGNYDVVHRSGDIVSTGSGNMPPVPSPDAVARRTQENYKAPTPPPQQPVQPPDVSSSITPDTPPPIKRVNDTPKDDNKSDDDKKPPTDTGRYKPTINPFGPSQG